MPFCTNCGKQNPDDARFCSQCGTRSSRPTPRRRAARAGGESTATITIGGAGADKAETSDRAAQPGRRGRRRRAARRARAAGRAARSRAPAAGSCSTPTWSTPAGTPTARSSSTT